MILSDFLITDALLAVLSASLIFFSYVPTIQNWLRASKKHPAFSWSSIRDRLPFQNVINPQGVLRRTYEKVNQTQKPCALPSVLDKQMMLPTSWMPWLLAQPNTVLSQSDFIDSILNIKFGPMHPDLYDGHKYALFSTRKLNGRRDAYPEEIMENLAKSFEREWGSNTSDFQEVHLEKSLTQIITSATNRVLVGPELCQDQRYLNSITRFVKYMFISGSSLHLVPRFLKTVVASIIMVPAQFLIQGCSSHLYPIFDTVRESIHEDSSDTPEIYATWLVKQCINQSGQITTPMRKLVLRVLGFNFATTINTTFYAVQAMLDIYSAEPSQECSEKIMAEFEEHERKFGKTWNKQRLGEMVRVESALRESMRISSLFTRVLSRKVVPAGGLTLPDGTLASAGTTLCFGGHGIQQDPTNYPDAMTFHGDRFLSRYTDADRSSKNSLQSIHEEGEEGSSGNDLQLTKQAAVGDFSYLPFGYGRYVCPGRFFAVDMIKLIISYAIGHYEIEALAERPQHRWMEYYCLPSRNARLRVRRRAEI